MMDLRGTTMRIQLSEHFTYKKLLRFVISPVLMMICTSLYSIIDGIFVSNYVGKTPFAAVNLILPVAMAIGAVGFMIGTGGSAIVSKTLGEGKKELANQYFTMLVGTAFLLGAALSITGFIFLPQIVSLLGATGDLAENCIIYGRIMFISQTAFMLQNVFQNFFVTAERPDLSLKMSVASGLTNIALDYLFIAVFHWGIAGAAIATAIGEFMGGFVPVFFFARKNNSLLRLVKTPIRLNILGRACLNGSSEMVTNLSSSLINMLYNLQLMKLAGENGVAAYGVIMYANFVFMAVFFGYSIGSAPIVGYHYGADNHSELKNLFQKSLQIVLIAGISMLLISQSIASPLVKIFAGYDIELYTLTVHGFRLYSLAFIFMGINVFGSAFFTALNNGFVSATISFLRTLVFQIAAVFILPLFLAIDGIWLSIVAAEVLASLVTIQFFIRKRKRYHY